MVLRVFHPVPLAFFIVLMAQVIELPGEANPLSLQNVQNAIALAASSTQQRIQTGTQQLQNWEKQEMYYTFLQVLAF